RLYLNNVTLIDFYRRDQKDNLVIAFKRSAQKLEVQGDELLTYEQSIYSENEIMILQRDTGAGNAKGILLAHSCPNCGGPVKDTLDLKCSFCGEILNSTHFDWIVADLMDRNSYSKFTDGSDIKPALDANVNSAEPLFKIRDLALNNVMLILSCDGKVEGRELDFLKKYASKLGYDNKKLDGMYDTMKSRSLSVRLPDERKDAEKVYTIMKKAAWADGNVSAAESSLLEEIRKKIDEMKDSN
ncbi:MAG TPA: hypothetical protein VL651_05075, partial [Bacteroidia bacterium]|nr:hypothetical protein [Bacteroidia bacterium]